MGRATIKINNGPENEYSFDDLDTGLELSVQDGNVIVNQKILFHGSPLDDMEIRAFDLSGRHSSFKNVGEPKREKIVVRETVAVETVGSRLARQIPTKNQVAGVLAENFAQDTGKVMRKLQRKAIEKTIMAGVKGIFGGLFEKEKKK